MIINREITEKLETWKNGKDRSPLIIQGARQIGALWNGLSHIRVRDTPTATQA